MNFVEIFLTGSESVATAYIPPKELKYTTCELGAHRFRSRRIRRNFRKVQCCDCKMWLGCQSKFKGKWQTWGYQMGNEVRILNKDWLLNLGT